MAEEVALHLARHGTAHILAGAGGWAEWVKIGERKRHVGKRLSSHMQPALRPGLAWLCAVVGERIELG